MKIVNIHRAITAEELAERINRELDPHFATQRQTAMHFLCEINEDGVEIYQTKLYDGFLFRIAIRGENLHITRSEHYVDDVNSLTVESILSEIIGELSDDGVAMVQEG